MPLTACGRYELAITPPSQAPGLELCAHPFTFIPVARIAVLIFAALATAFAIARPRRFRELGSRRWLLLPPALGVAALGLQTPLGRLDQLLPPIFLGQMIGLSLGLWLVCRLASRRRVAAFAMVLFINAAALLVSAVIANNAWDWWCMFILPCFLVCLSWTLPAALGFLALRRGPSNRRLAAGLLVAWGVTAAGMLAILAVTTDMPIGTEWALPFALIPLAYLAGLYLFAALNPWCRQGLTRALGLGAASAEK